jgi:hypothetical protein
MAQDTNRFVCEGCGKQFNDRNELQNHTQNCQAMKASQGGSQGSQRGSQGSQQGSPGSQSGSQGSQQGSQGSQRGSQGSQQGSQGSQPGQGGSDRPKTKTAGGQGMPESQE